jgi:hypothetical protein
VLPADSTLSGGTGTFAVTLKTAGSQTVIATDTQTASLAGSLGLVVTPAAASRSVLFGSVDSHRGRRTAFTIVARDPFGNTATGYDGTVTFTSSDPLASVPAGSKLTGGTGAFDATLKTAGNQTITASDSTTPAISSQSAGIVVAPAAAAKLVLSAPSFAKAGRSFAVTVAARDQFGNPATGYAGTVRLTSSDPLATLPRRKDLGDGDRRYRTVRHAQSHIAGAPSSPTSSSAAHSQTQQRVLHSHPYGTVYATTCGCPPPALVVGPPAGTMMVLPAMAIGALADVGRCRR